MALTDTASVHQSDRTVCKMRLLFMLFAAISLHQPQLITFNEANPSYHHHVLFSVQLLFNDVQKRVNNVTTLIRYNKLITADNSYFSADW